MNGHLKRLLTPSGKRVVPYSGTFTYYGEIRNTLEFLDENVCYYIIAFMSLSCKKGVCFLNLKVCVSMCAHQGYNNIVHDWLILSRWFFVGSFGRV